MGGINMYKPSTYGWFIALLTLNATKPTKKTRLEAECHPLPSCPELPSNFPLAFNSKSS
jgi:hypothetical protein